MRTIWTFDNSIQAHIYRTKLESEGIQAFIWDEWLITLNPLYNLALGGIKLVVDNSQHDESIRILNELNNSPSILENGNTLVCPNCKSTNYIHRFVSMKGIFGVSNFLLAIILMVYPPYLKFSKKCKVCKTEFNEE